MPLQTDPGFKGNAQVEPYQGDSAQISSTLDTVVPSSKKGLVLFYVTYAGVIVKSLNIVLWW